MRVALVVLAAVLAAACTVTETRTVTVPAAGDACSAYGYVPGTEGYRICAERELAARRRATAPSY